MPRTKRTKLYASLVRIFLDAENNGGYEPTEDTSLVIKSVAPSKVPAQPPTMAPIERTSTYLLRNRRTSVCVSEVRKK